MLTKHYRAAEELAWSGVAPSPSLTSFALDKMRFVMSAFWMFILGLVFGVNFGVIALGLCRTTATSS